MIERVQELLLIKITGDQPLKLVINSLKGFFRISKPIAQFILEECGRTNIFLQILMMLLREDLFVLTLSK
jgi:hypothetical protein